MPENGELDKPKTETGVEVEQQVVDTKKDTSKELTDHEKNVGDTIVDEADTMGNIDKMIAEAGGHNKYSQMMVDLAKDVPGVAEHPLYMAVTLFAIKYGALFDNITNFLVPFNERINDPDFAGEKILQNEVLALNTAMPAEDILANMSFEKENNESLQSASTRFAYSTLFGAVDPVSGAFIPPSSLINDPIRLAAKLEHGHFDQASNNTKPYISLFDKNDMLADFSMPAKSVVIFSVNSPKTDGASKEPAVIAGLNSPFLSGVFDGNGNVVYFGPSKDDAISQIRTVPIAEFQAKEYTVKMILKKSPDIVQNIIDGNTATVADATGQGAPATVPAPGPAPGPQAPVAPGPAPEPAPADAPVPQAPVAPADVPGPTIN